MLYVAGPEQTSFKLSLYSTSLLLAGLPHRLAYGISYDSKMPLWLSSVICARYNLQLPEHLTASGDGVLLYVACFVFLSFAALIAFLTGIIISCLDISCN
jgi:hypothetical protein